MTSVHRINRTIFEVRKRCYLSDDSRWRDRDLLQDEVRRTVHYTYSARVAITYEADTSTGSKQLSNRRRDKQLRMAKQYKLVAQYVVDSHWYEPTNNIPELQADTSAFRSAERHMSKGVKACRTCVVLFVS